MSGMYAVRRPGVARAAHASRAARKARRRRRIAGLLRLVVFLVIVVVAIWAGTKVAHAGDDGRLYTGQPHVVRAGESVWSVAAQHYGPDVDLRRAVYDIRKVNGLDNGTVVHPGETLLLPYEGE